MSEGRVGVHPAPPCGGLFDIGATFPRLHRGLITCAPHGAAGNRHGFAYIKKHRRETAHLIVKCLAETIFQCTSPNT